MWVGFVVLFWFWFAFILGDGRLAVDGEVRCSFLGSVGRDI